MPPTSKTGGRGGDTRRRFEQWAHNPQCQANTLSAVHGIEMRAVAKFEGGTPTMGQSPFALARGRNFERILFRDGASALLAELVKQGVLPKGSSGFKDFRLKLNGGTARTLEEAQALTTDILRVAATEPARVPAVLTGATVTIPGNLMLPKATLVLDVIVFRQRKGDGKTELVVGEIKTYPDRAGYTDPAELAGARAQAGVYVHGLELVLSDLGLEKQLVIAREGLLVLSRPGSNQPSVRASEDLRFQSERAKRGFALLHAAATAVDPLPEPEKESGLRVVAEAATAYDETCLSFCDRAELCRKKGLDAGNAAVLGRDVARFLGLTSLPRAVELLEGAKPANEAEADLVRRITDARTRGGLQ
ncbi:MAG: hypothetical protein U0Q55_21175 [Vicinamibacterales bacterium]